MLISLRKVGTGGLGLFLFLAGCDVGEPGKDPAAPEQAASQTLTAAQAKGAQDCLAAVQQCHEADPHAQGMKQCFTQFDGCLNTANADLQVCFEQVSACIDALPAPVQCGEQLGRCLGANNLPPAIPPANLPNGQVPGCNGGNGGVPDLPGLNDLIGGNGGLPNLPGIPDINDLIGANGGNMNVAIDVDISIDGQTIEVLQQCMQQVLAKVQECVGQVQACVGQIQPNGQIPACLQKIESCVQEIPTLATQCKP